MSLVARQTNGKGADVAAASENAFSSVEKVRRQDVGVKLTLVLFVKAGGRCERRGCNKTLIEQHVSKQPGNFADKAHIVAFREELPVYSVNVPGTVA